MPQVDLGYFDDINNHTIKFNWYQIFVISFPVTRWFGYLVVAMAVVHSNYCLNLIWICMKQTTIIPHMFILLQLLNIWKNIIYFKNIISYI